METRKWVVVELMRQSDKSTTRENQKEKGSDAGQSPSFAIAHARKSHIELEVHNVAVLHHVLLAFLAQLAGVAAAQLAA